MGLVIAFTAFNHAARAAAETRTDDTLGDSFPASDPPNWMGFVRIGCPQRHVAEQREEPPCALE